MTTRTSIRLRLTLLCTLLGLTSVLASGCYDTPKPKCAFLCGTASECPVDYMCGPADNRCHLVEDNGALAVCEDSLPMDGAVNDAPIDAGNPIDGAMGPDGMADAGPPPTTHSGTVSVQDITIANAPSLGHGLQVTVDLTPVDTNVPVFNSIMPPGVGCVAYVYDLSMGQIPPVSSDEGTVTIAGATSTIPPCSFVAGAGYVCIASGGGAGALAATASPGLTTLTDAAAAFSAADVGRYVKITGPAPGSYPIVGVDVATHTLAVAGSGPTTFTSYTIIAGLGPVPFSFDFATGMPGPAPDTLANADNLTISIAPGGGNDFMFPPTAGVAVGDAFTLDATSQNLITNVPDTATAISFDCAGGTGCGGGSALGSIITITTTDAAIPPGVPSYYMPPATTKIGYIRCAVFGTAVNIPAAAMAAIESANPTRIRTTFLRVGLGQTGNPMAPVNPVNMVAGHGIVGFTDHVQCTVPADCGANTDCITRSCVANMCGMAFQPVGTVTSSQTSGDCQENQCNATGGIMSVDDNGDTPSDGNQCTSDSCVSGTPTFVDTAVGSACTSGGGTVCNGAGMCVECNVAGDCVSLVCTGNVCQAASCTDTVQNGDETDNDCGGSCPLNCADGQGCAVGADCTSSVCTGTICQTPSCSDSVKNGLETDTDCGGPCPMCANGKTCNVNGDCTSDNCAGGVCSP